MGAITLQDGTAMGIVGGPSGTFTFNNTGVTSVRAGSGGTQRTGDIALIAGTNLTITDNGDGTFTLTPSGGSAVLSVTKKVTGGTYTLSTGMSAYADVDATNLGGSIAAAAGDILQFSLSGVISSNSAEGTFLDVFLTNSGHYVGASGASGDQGISGWANRSVGADTEAKDVGGIVHYTVQAGDISGGSVAFKLRYLHSQATAQSFYATAAIPLFFACVNLKH